MVDPACAERLQNQRPTFAVPPDLSTIVKEIWIGNVLLLETLLLNFLPATKPFWRKNVLGWVRFIYIYLFLGSFDDTERGGEISFLKINAIESRNFIMSSC